MNLFVKVELFIELLKIKLLTSSITVYGTIITIILLFQYEYSLLFSVLECSSETAVATTGDSEKVNESADHSAITWKGATKLVATFLVMGLIFWAIIHWSGADPSLSSTSFDSNKLEFCTEDLHQFTDEDVADM